MSNTDNNSLVSGLRNCEVSAESRSVDWAEAIGEDMEGWQAFAVEECEECGRSFVVSSNMGQDQHRYIEPEFEDEDGEEVENECMGTCGYFEGPMMNHFYPCEFIGLDHDDAARAIAHLPLCVVELECGETGFALTGGGMDLSWEICDAYISCGYLPPFQYTGLPRMAGKHKHPRAQLILAACRRSCEILKGWAERRDEDLARMGEEFKTASTAA
jgi:hypothetical protein